MSTMKIISISILALALTMASVSISQATLGYTAGEFKIVNDSKNDVDVIIFQGTCAKLAVKKTDDDSKTIGGSIVSGLKSFTDTPDCNKKKGQTLGGKIEAAMGGWTRSSMTIAPGQWAVAFKQGNNPNAFIPAICLPDKQKNGNILLLQTPKIAGISIGFKCKQVEVEPKD